MVSLFSTLAATCVALTAIATTSTCVHAHGRITNPVVTFSGKYPDSPVDQIDGYKALPPPSGQSYSGKPETNTKAFTEAFQQSSFKTLRAFVLAKQSNNVRACGDTTVDRTPRQRLPDMVEFTFRPGEGFVPDHQGPCEIWCGNNTRVFHDDNCAKTYRDGPAKLPYDKAQCDGSGDDVLTFYWLALHLPKWQLYINCAGIATSGAKTPSSASPAPSPTAAADSDGKVPARTTAPSPTTTKPVVAPKTTPAPATTEVPQKPTTPQPQSSSMAPAATEPVAPASKCRVRQLRN